MANCPKRVLDFSKFPGWFRPEPGFKFLDDGGDRCIVVGEGGFRKIDTVGLYVGEGDDAMRIGNVEKIAFKPWTLLIAFNYKGEWHLADAFTYDSLPGGKPGWD